MAYKPFNYADVVSVVAFISHLFASHSALITLYASVPNKILHVAGVPANKAQDCARTHSVCLTC